MPFTEILNHSLKEGIFPEDMKRSNSQYGFREKHFCTDAVMELTIEILKARKRHQNTISVFLDLSKEFDML